jgi:hypothetical protein
MNNLGVRRGVFMQAKDSAAMAYSSEPQVLAVSVLKPLEEAAEFLYEDYKSDKNLTEFTQLDGEDFYEAK